MAERFEGFGVVTFRGIVDAEIADESYPHLISVVSVLVVRVVVVGVVKVDIDAEENYEIVTQCSIRSVPTLKFFKNGTSVETIVGMAPKNKLDESFANLAN